MAGLLTRRYVAPGRRYALILLPSRDEFGFKAGPLSANFAPQP
jgi:hypothetical protein